MIKNNKKGITLVVLVITIIVLLILAGITVYTGKGSIKEAKLEALKTNMLLIQTKAREYVENASFDLGVDPNNATAEMKEKAQNELSGADKGRLVSEDDSIKDELVDIGISLDDIKNGKVYILETENLKNMGINDVESNATEGWYVIVYNIEDTSAEIYNTMGYNGKYSLTELEQIET